MKDQLTKKDIQEVVKTVLKEELPPLAKATYKAVKNQTPESVRTDLRDDAINDYLSSLADLENSMGSVVMALQKIQSEYKIMEAGRDGYPFGDRGIDDEYKAVVHFVATQTEVLSNRYLNAK